jgi:hypothetical protein
MKMIKPPAQRRRERLLGQIEQLASQAIFGTLSQTYRTCGTAGCRCHHGGPKHGPHLYVSYCGRSGKTTGYYVPKARQSQIRQGVQAWNRLQKNLRRLALLNKRAIIPDRKKKTFATGSS